MNKCKIVVYHYVRPIKNSQYKINGMEVENFEKQIKMLKTKYNPIGTKEMIEAINNNKTVPKDSIMFTFDDGLKDHYKYVFPLLKENNIEGIFFPSGKPIQEKMVLDVHKIQFILGSVKDPNSIILEIKKSLNNFKKKFSIEPIDSYYKKYAIEDRFDTKEVTFIKNLLQKGLPLKLRSKLVSYLFKKYVTKDEKSFSKKLYLTINEIYKMKNSGMVFGSHGYSHYWLATLTEKELTEELRNNEEFLKKISGNYKLICYPHGSYNNLVIKKIREQDFQFGLTTEVGDAVLNKENRFKIKRFDCNNFAF